MSIKGLQRNFSHRSHRRSSVLDKTLTVKDILKYVGYGALFLGVLFLVVIIPFMIGRASMTCHTPTAEIENKSAKVDAATSLIDNIAEDVEDNSTDIEEEEPEEVPEEEPEPEEEEEEESEDEYDEDARYLRTDPRVATSYSDVDIDLMDFTYDMRGSDWGTIDTVKIMITNNQDQIIIPYTLKMKIYNVGDYASDWWDDEVNLRDHLNIIIPGGYKIIELDTHVSFSESGTKKRFGVYLFDEVGKSMTSRVKEVSID